jgi:hypothetical protein
MSTLLPYIDDTPCEYYRSAAREAVEVEVAAMQEQTHHHQQEIGRLQEHRKALAIEYAAMAQQFREMDRHQWRKRKHSGQTEDGGLTDTTTESSALIRGEESISQWIFMSLVDEHREPFIKALENEQLAVRVAIWREKRKNWMLDKELLAVNVQRKQLQENCQREIQAIEKQAVDLRATIRSIRRSLRRTIR